MEAAITQPMTHLSATTVAVVCSALNGSLITGEATKSAPISIYVLQIFKIHRNKNIHSNPYQKETLRSVRSFQALLYLQKIEIVG